MRSTAPLSATTRSPCLMPACAQQGSTRAEPAPASLSDELTTYCPPTDLADWLPVLHDPEVRTYPATECWSPSLSSDTADYETGWV
eukprot:6176991-Pleurochrysis_carterae.AAC.1